MKYLSKFDTQNHQNQSNKINREVELLICCVRPQVDEIITERIKALVMETIDWQKLLEMAQQHKVVPILYTRLNTICSKNIPNSVLSNLRSRFQTTATYNLLATGELIRLLRLLKEQGILALPYKGPILAQLIYNNIGLRQFDDLDIVVQEKDIFAVAKLLVAQGYEPKQKMNQTELIAYLQSKTEHTYDFFHEQKGIFIEVHWRFTPKYVSPIEPKDLWENLQLFSFAGTTVNNFSLEDYLPILCVHGSRHIWQRLAWLCDIATLIHNNPSLDWEKVIQRAKFWGCKRRLCLGLLMVHHLFEVTLSEKIWQEISEDTLTNNLVPEIYDEIFGEVKTSDKFMGTTLYHIQTRERLQDKLLYAQSFANWLIKGSKLKTA
jgi:Uncharacterised nucleotidyltransferase